MHALKRIRITTFDETFARINIILDIDTEVFQFIPIVIRIDLSIPKLLFVFTYKISQKSRNSCINRQMLTEEFNADEFVGICVVYDF